MDNGLNNTLVIATVLTLGGILCLIGGFTTSTPMLNLAGFIALVAGVAVGVGEVVGIARHKRSNTKRRPDPITGDLY